MKVCEYGKPVHNLYMFPTQLRMLNDTYRCFITQKLTYLLENNIKYIPVTHCIQKLDFNSTSDNADSTFYYYANGCSKLFLKLGNIIVGNNKFDVHLKMLEKVMGKSYIKNVILTNTCGIDKYEVLKIRRFLNPCTQNISDWCIRNIKVKEEKGL